MASCKPRWHIGPFIVDIQRQLFRSSEPVLLKIVCFDTLLWFCLSISPWSTIFWDMAHKSLDSSHSWRDSQKMSRCSPGKGSLVFPVGRMCFLRSGMMTAHLQAVGIPKDWQRSLRPFSMLIMANGWRYAAFLGPIGKALLQEEGRKKETYLRPKQKKPSLEKWAPQLIIAASPFD